MAEIWKETATCEARRLFLRRGAALAAACAILLAETVPVRRAAAQTKAPQNLVQYQKTPKDGKDCASCNYFEPPSSCKVVAGPISPAGWCSLYAPKAPA
ncbi:MAG: high potential iron sulfur protein [Xanthobacteraceae bacterium]